MDAEVAVVSAAARQDETVSLCCACTRAHTRILRRSAGHMWTPMQGNTWWESMAQQRGHSGQWSGACAACSWHVMPLHAASTHPSCVGGSANRKTHHWQHQQLGYTRAAWLLAAAAADLPSAWQVARLQLLALHNARHQCLSWVFLIQAYTGQGDIHSCSRREGLQQWQGRIGQQTVSLMAH